MRCVRIDGEQCFARQPDGNVNVGVEKRSNELVRKMRRRRDEEVEVETRRSTRGSSHTPCLVTGVEI